MNQLFLYSYIFIRTYLIEDSNKKQYITIEGKMVWDCKCHMQSPAIDQCLRSFGKNDLHNYREIHLLWYSYGDQNVAGLLGSMENGHGPYVVSNNVALSVSIEGKSICANDKRRM